MVPRRQRGHEPCVLLARDALLGNLASPAWLAFIFLWLFAVVLGSALSVVRHADQLAVRLGESLRHADLDPLDHVHRSHEHLRRNDA